MEHFVRSVERDSGPDSPNERRRPPPPPPHAPLETGTSPPRQIDLAVWQARLAELEVNKTFMNRLVLDYLVIEGYKDAAEAFARESGVAPEVDLDTISDRMSIRESVQRGDVEAAVARVNELDPTILRGNSQLAFHLRQQQLIEIIREGRIEDALVFAQQELAPAGEQNPAFLEELERTMALLAFEDSATCPVGHLLEPTQRYKTASELNGAILASQAQQTEPKLPTVLRMLQRTQKNLAEKNIVFPQVTDLASARFSLGTNGPGDTCHGSNSKLPAQAGLGPGSGAGASTRVGISNTS
mmetsp:Transcript_23141/g.59467  ORF Transcript_23141/g.59467 Transcript_23141/m.59467 type:complete len:299 (+) Transcript_23141:59-955(+)